MKKKVEVEVESALYHIMDRKAKAEDRIQELLRIIENKNVKIRAMEQERLKLREENADLREAVEEYEAGGAKRRPKPKPVTRTTGPGAKTPGGASTAGGADSFDRDQA